LNFYKCGEKLALMIVEDVAFSSHTDGGKLKYSTPSISKLHGVSKEAFDEFDSLEYELSLMDFDDMT
jgi:hypothetical protein